MDGSNIESSMFNQWEVTTPVWWNVFVTWCHPLFVAHKLKHRQGLCDSCWGTVDCWCWSSPCLRATISQSLFYYICYIITFLSPDLLRVHPKILNQPLLVFLFCLLNENFLLNIYSDHCECFSALMMLNGVIRQSLNNRDIFSYYEWFYGCQLLPLLALN